MLTTDFTWRSLPGTVFAALRLLISSFALFMSTIGLANVCEPQLSKEIGAMKGVSAEQQAADQRVDAIFTDDADITELGTDRCLSVRRKRDVDALDQRTLLFDMGRNNNYVVRLVPHSIGLRPDSPISY